MSSVCQLNHGTRYENQSEEICSLRPHWEEGQTKGPGTPKSIFRVRNRGLGLSEEQSWSHPSMSLLQSSARWPDGLSELCDLDLQPVPSSSMRLPGSSDSWGW